MIALVLFQNVFSTYWSDIKSDISCYSPTQLASFVSAWSFFDRSANLELQHSWQTFQERFAPVPCHRQFSAEFVSKTDLFLKMLAIFTEKVKYFFTFYIYRPPLTNCNFQSVFWGLSFKGKIFMGSLIFHISLFFYLWYCCCSKLFPIHSPPSILSLVHDGSVTKIRSC